MFRPAAPTSVESRVEQTDQAFLSWLSKGGREEVLEKCVAIDLAQRGVAGAAESLETLRDKRDKATRVVVMELLARGLYLHRYANAHEYIALHSTPEEVVDKAAGIISAMHPTGEFMSHFGISWNVVAASECLDMSWPMLYLKFVIADEEHADDVMKLHMLMSTRMGGGPRARRACQSQSRTMADDWSDIS